MSKSVDEILKDVLKAEGGYTNDSDDRGGPTKYGVTIHTMRRLGMDLNGDGRITASDVKMLTVDQALEIFKRDYFFKPRISQLPDLLHDTVLDMQINSGSNAVKLLQRLVNKLRVPGVKLKVDGAIGPNTIAGVEAVIDQVNDNRKFWNMYGIERRSFYMRIADRRPTQRKYAMRRDGGKGGWITRAEHYIDPEYHWTPTQWNKRVSRR